jgi:hypothetical protein
MPRKGIDLKGKRFGKLIVLDKSKKNKRNRWLWECLCDCGSLRIASGDDLRRGHTRSCGCLVGFKHGGCKTRLYRIFIAMKERCYYKKSINYIRYGAKGITVCDEWVNDFETFRDWALKAGYRDNLTIDRKDNKEGYRPSNCRWVTAMVNNRHRDNIKLSMRDAIFIRELLRCGNTQEKIANIYGVHQSTVSLIKRNKIWT